MSGAGTRPRSDTLCPFARSHSRASLVSLADETGLAAIVAKMDELAAIHGDRFKPTPELRDAAERNQPMQSIADAASNTRQSGAPHGSALQA